MKLLRYGPEGQEKPGLLDDSGALRDLSGEIDDLAPDTLGPDTLKRLRALDPGSLPAVDGKSRLGPPVAGSRKFLGLRTGRPSASARVWTGLGRGFWPRPAGRGGRV